MTDDEIEKKAQAEYEATREHHDQPWADLPEVRRVHWREMVRRDRGFPAQRDRAP